MRWRTAALDVLHRLKRPTKASRHLNPRPHFVGRIRRWLSDDYHEVGRDAGACSQDERHEEPACSVGSADGTADDYFASGICFR